MEFSASRVPLNTSKTTNKASRSWWSLVLAIFSTQVLLVAILILQVVMVWLVIDPPYLRQQTLANQIVSEVSKLTTVNVNEQPQVGVISDAQSLRDDNAIHAQVYKDADKGDYVIGYTDKLIIYRRNQNKIVYEGDSPTAIANKNQQQLMDAIVAKVKNADLIADNSDEVPQLSVVTDAAAVKPQNPTFYANVAKDDVVALFSTASVIVIYRSSTDEIINSGTFSTVISPN